MKKYIMLFFALMIIPFSIMFTGCNKDDGIYDIKVSKNIEHGSVMCETEESLPGEVIYVYYQSDTGYKLKAIYVNGDLIIGNSFIMPAKNVQIFAVFEEEIK